MYIHHVHICTTKTHYIVYVYNVSAQSVYRRPLFHRAHTQKQEFDIYTKVSCASQKRKVPVRRYSKEYFESLRSYLNEKKNLYILLHYYRQGVLYNKRMKYIKKTWSCISLPFCLCRQHLVYMGVCPFKTALHKSWNHWSAILHSHRSN